MSAFLISIAVFISVHLILPIPQIRNRLIGLIGKRPYLLLYSLLSIGLIVWVIAAARNAPYIELWPPRPWQALVPLLVVPIAAWLLIGGLTEPNPLSISLRSASVTRIGGVARIIRHPVLWGFLLWAASHVVTNGDLVSIIMFGGLAALALGGFGLVDLRARRRLGSEKWGELARLTSVIPFAAILAGRNSLEWSWRLSALTAVALGAAVWFILQGHAWMVGVDPLARL